MIWAVSLLIGAGVTLCYRLRHRPGHHRVLALLGTTLAILAFVTGFSIGIFIAPIAAIVLVFAASGAGPTDRVT